MPKAKATRGIDFEAIQKMRRENPDDFFSREETDRRMTEVMRRAMRMPGTFDLHTGQNYGEPKLTEQDLKDRGYPWKPRWDD